MKDRVLVIDPSRILPEPLSAFLSGRGYEVDNTVIEAEALRKMSEHHYALIFISMIDSEGISQLREIRNRARAPFQIIVSGPDVVSSAVTAFQNGANHYWANPVSMTDVTKLFDESSILAPAGKRYQREEALLQIIKEIALTMELDGLVNILMDSAMELTRADGGALLLLDEKSRSLIRKSVRGVSGGEQEDELFGMPESQYHKILLDRKPVLLNDPQSLGNRKVRALIAAPIWSRDEPLGLLVNVKFASNKHSFSNDDYKVLSLLIDEISGAVFNAVTHYKTKELTIKDDLTEAYNRRYFERYLEEEFMRARRYGSNLSLIFFDVDNLKEVNMQHGHLTGSKTLQEVARRMILTVRGIDKVVRYGGDEFCVVLPETDSQGAFQVAERIRNVIASKQIVINENIQVAITGSIGIASYPTHAHSKDELVRQADKAMFVIKGKSKNAIAIAEVPAREQATKAEGDS
ncbi:diguanylate cyclase [bacterium]|nr:diguanylate cyclase [bacterium]MCI0612364.1 diguanylate cyclase [bacterium]